MAVAVNTALILLIAEVSEVEAITTDFFKPSGPSVSDTNSWTSLPLSPIKPITFTSAEEFFAIMERILRPIQEQKEILQSEKNSVTRLWRRREKGIEKSIQGAALLAGQLDSILGSKLTNQICFERFDLASLISEESAED